MAKPKGYHFQQTDEGAMAVEVDAPGEGIVTITWKPAADYPGNSAEIVMPTNIFASVVASYERERQANSKAAPEKT